MRMERNDDDPLRQESEAASLSSPERAPEEAAAVSTTNEPSLSLLEGVMARLGLLAVLERLRRNRNNDDEDDDGANDTTDMNNSSSSQLDRPKTRYVCGGRGGRAFIWTLLFTMLWIHPSDKTM